MGNIQGNFSGETFREERLKGKHAGGIAKVEIFRRGCLRGKRVRRMSEGNIQGNV